MHEKLLREPAVSKIDYAGAYDAETLHELREMQDEVLLAVAAWIGNTRLIDNMIINMRNVR
jgi:pantothenate synthetase